MTSLIWDPVELCELFGPSQNSLTENEEPPSGDTPWAMQSSNWTRINPGKLEPGRLSMIGWFQMQAVLLADSAIGVLVYAADG